MRIGRIELTNFRCIAAGTILLHPHLTFIGAQNAAGKSSILDAIEWCLTGRCRGTDERGAGSKELVRQGEAGMTVRCIMADGTYQARVISTGGKMSADPPEPLVDADVFRCLMNGAAFLDMGHATAKTLLMGVLGVSVEVDGRPMTLEQIEAAYQVAYEQRRQARANLNAIVVPPMPTGELPDIAEVEKRLNDLRAEEHVLTAKEAHAGGARAQAEKQLARAKESAERAVKEAATHPKAPELQAQIEALDALHAVPDDAPDDLRARDELVAVGGKLSQARDAAAWLEKFTPSKACVLSPAIPCNTPAAAFRTTLATTQTQVSQLGNRQKELEATLAEAARLRQRQQTTANERARLVSALVKADVLARSATEAEEEVRRLTAERDAAPVEQGPSPELVTLRERITRGEAVLREARELARQRIEHEDLTRRQAQAAEALQRLEQRCDLLGPKGARVAALANSLGKFEARINLALAQFGYSLRFQTEPWAVVVNGRDSELLSTSERIRCGMAFAMALAEATGVGFCAIDSADMLDEHGREVLADLVSDWTGGQVIVAATRTAGVPSSEDWTGYFLTRDGEGPTTIIQT